MSRESTPSRLEEILVERDDRALTSKENAELADLLEKNPDWHEDDLELAAAAAFLAFHKDTNVLPGELREKILETTGVSGLRVPLDRADTVKKVSIPPPDHNIVRLDERRSLQRTRVVSGIMGLAAGIAATVLAGLVYRIATRDPVVTTIQVAVNNAKKLPWSAAGDPLVKEISGEVTWDGDAQQGLMRFVGLPVNDPTKNQYQLWIFDAERDERYPIDGGVFDIAATGETIVPISAKLRVKQPTLFAITLEPPGGVVVSNREHLLVVAKVL